MTPKTTQEVTLGKRAGIQLCYPFEEKRLETWTPPYIVQPKLDGERCRAVLINKQTLMLSSEENLIFSAPKILEELIELNNRLNSSVELDGELYCHGMSFEKVHSIVGRTVKLNPEHDQLQYHLFDLVNQTLPQAQRIKKLRKLPLNGLNHIKIVPIRIVWTIDEIRRTFDEFVGLDYEGIIVRHFSAPYIRRRSTFVMKFKPKKSDVYPIVGFVEGQGKFKGTLGTLICESENQQFEVGSFSMTDEKRAELWNKRFELTNFNCKIAYQHRWSSGKPKSGVFLELVEREPEVNFLNPLE